MPVFAGARIQRGHGLGSILGGFFRRNRSSFRQEQRQERVDECRKDGHGGGGRRFGREIVEGVCQETRAGGYKTDGSLSEVSYRIWCSTREDQQEKREGYATCSRNNGFRSQTVVRMYKIGTGSVLRSADSDQHGAG